MHSRCSPALLADTCPPGRVSWQDVWAEVVLNPGDGGMGLPSSLEWSSREQGPTSGEDLSEQGWPVGPVLGKERLKLGPGQPDTCSPHPPARGRGSRYVYSRLRTGSAPEGDHRDASETRARARPVLGLAVGQVKGHPNAPPASAPSPAPPPKSYFRLSTDTCLRTSGWAPFRGGAPRPERRAATSSPDSPASPTSSRKDIKGIHILKKEDVCSF